MRRQPSLRSQLNQIRMWVRQGRTDAWIAHKLDVSIEQLARFKQDHALNEASGTPARPADPLSVPPPIPEPEADGVEEEPEEPEEPEVSEPEAEEAESQPIAEAEADEDIEDAAEEGAVERDGDERPVGARPSRRRGRRGGRRRRGRGNSYEATFDHGEDGYGLWLDPAVVDNPVYAEHWAGHRAIRITLDCDAITIRRAGEEGEGDAPGGDRDIPGGDR